MSRHAKLLILIAVLVMAAGSMGCGRKPAALNGTWKVDGDKILASMKETDEYKKAPEQNKPMIEKVVKEKFASITFTFADPKLTVKMFTGDPTEAEYKIKSMKGDTWEIETTGLGGKTATWPLKWISDDQIVLTPPRVGDAPQIDFTLNRQK